MKIFRSRIDPELVALLQAGGIAVVRTDTLYGLVARADDEQAVERVYMAKQRDPSKGCIVLVADESMLYDQPPTIDDPILSQVWPGPVSVVLPSPSAPDWLLRVGDDTLAYRCPADAELRALVAQTGPLIAPSANPEGLLPAGNIEQAIAYFGDAVDAYIDSGDVPAGVAASQLIVITQDGTVQRLR